MTFEEILAIPPYSLAEEEKNKLLTERLIELTKLHQRKCPDMNARLSSRMRRNDSPHRKYPDGFPRFSFHAYGFFS